MSNMKQTKIVFRNTLYKGDRSYKVIRWENVLSESELPREYVRYSVEATPRFYATAYKDGDELHVYEKDNNAYLRIEVGAVMDKQYRDRVLTTMKAAGKRLHEINQRIARDRECWEGIECIVPI